MKITKNWLYLEKERKMNSRCFSIFVVFSTLVSLGFVLSGAGMGDDSEREGFTFALTGDIPRLGDAELEPDLLQFKRVRDEINAANVAFVVHDGDFKSGASPCTDDCFQRWYTMTGTFDAPFFFINGAFGFTF